MRLPTLPIDSAALAVLKLRPDLTGDLPYSMPATVTIFMADLIYAMRNYGFKLDIVKDERV